MVNCYGMAHIYNYSVSYIIYHTQECVNLRIIMILSDTAVEILIRPDFTFVYDKLKDRTSRIQPSSILIEIWDDKGFRETSELIDLIEFYKENKL